MTNIKHRDNHVKQTLNLAWPLIITQVGHIVVGIVDTVFVGKIGPTEQAACIISNNLYVLILVFSIGVSYATTPLVTQANEKGNLLKQASLFKNSLFLNFFIACLSFIALYFLSDALRYMQQPAQVVDLAIPFYDVLIFSMLPVSLFFTCKQYCEGLSNTKMALTISIVGNLINIILNYLLIYGHLGLPKMGYMGAAWATFIARLFMGISFLIYVFKSPITKEINKVYKQTKLNFDELKQLAKIGLNAGLQFTFEVAAFVVAGLMAGTFGKEQIDAHGIALNLAAFTYMFGSGISSATTIRIGIYKSQENWKMIKAAGFTSIKLVMLVMGFFTLLFFALNTVLPQAFSNEKEILELASKLLIIAAFFQLFDGTQVTLIGILRGLEDVKMPTIITLIGYWVIALPLAYYLAFVLKMETVGIWIALLSSLVFVALFLFLRFNHLLKKNGV
jgi:MATE family multidrug resistance protein